MSAVKIIFKRSSLLGKRPTGANLEPGEIGLNTNSTDPGLFFEVNDGSVVKAGPTSYLPEALTQGPARGELWVDSDTKILSVGNDVGKWQKVAAPFLGGTSGFTVFVAPEYQNATDSLANDGQAVPFVTVNRAILEVTKQIILDTQRGLSQGNNRYLIVLAPGRHCVVNTPGQPVETFNVILSDPYRQVTQEDLAAFNPPEDGGLILPRGVSIIGMDLKKVEVHPTYVPYYTHPGFPQDYTQEENGPVYQNQPLSSVFRWSGNTYVSNFTGLDKIDSRLVVQTSSQEGTGWAVFSSNRPHGLEFNDFVQVEYSDAADQGQASFASRAYYAYPLNSYDFLLSTGVWGSKFETPVLGSSLPPVFSTTQSAPDPKFNVLNIYPYFVPLKNPATGALLEPYEYSSYSHHRLSLLKNASTSQLNAFYTKVQKAFPNTFSGQVNQALVSSPEVDIVASAIEEYPNNLSSNSTDNTSPYQNMVNHRSDYGMANGDYDGNLVTGFKSVIINSSTAVVLQKDPVAYEIYTTSDQDWIQLTEYTRQYLADGRPIVSIPTKPQLNLLNQAAIPNIRYYYQNKFITDPSTGQQKSVGYPDPENDFRHFGFRMQGSNSYMQAQSNYTIGAAISCWAKAGAIISLTNATTNFGSVAFQAEGFAGLGTLGGANQINKGFLLSGVMRPLRLLEESVVSDEQKRILFLGSKIMGVGADPSDSNVQLIYLQRPFDPASILPFSLKPGSAVFTSDGVCTFRAFFVTDGTSTCVLSAAVGQNPYSEGGAILRVRLSDSTIPGGVSSGLEIPYIRRFVDPRSDSDKSYGFYVQSTNPTSQAPQLGSVLRLNQTGQNLSNTLKRNFQFDPGQYGGISQVFTVDLVLTEQYSISANFNYKVADASQASNYVVYASLTDASSPWVQTLPLDPANPGGPLTPAANPQGSYITYQNQNYYSAENNLWQALYYETTFNPLNGPIKVSPNKPDSPFVVTSVLEKTEPIDTSWQGSVPDTYYDFYVSEIPSPYRESLSYMRGAVVPYTEFAPQYQVDEDDGTPNLGIIFNTVPLDTEITTLVAPSTVAQTPEDLTSPYVADPSFGRPEIIRLQFLAVQQMVQPKEGLSILQLSDTSLGAVEYVRVISLNSNIALAIRNYYPEYAVGTLPAVWPRGTTVKVCVSSGYPEPSVYDPAWAVTKATMFRFFQLMGYAPSLVAGYLSPRYSGERLLLTTDLPLSPVNGYANSTAAWPVEFNNPSSIIANTHTWQYVGYLDYSRGLPKYQVNEIPKKLSYDYLSTTTWGGRLTVMGANEQGQLVFLGPIKEALTAQYFVNETPLSVAADRQIYKSPDPVELPNPVLVFSVDDISGQFDGIATVFELKRGGYNVPASQLSTAGTFVFLGGVVQKPQDAYYIIGESAGAPVPQIAFSEAPQAGTSCDIRIVSSDDENQSVEVMTFGLSPNFNGIQSSFTVSPAMESLTNLNSFVFLSGVEQNPDGLTQTDPAYNINSAFGVTSLSFIAGAPQDYTIFDMRGILSGSRYRNSGVSAVFVKSVDDIAPLFNNTLTTFPLSIGSDPLDPNKVNAENIFVSLGGVMQIPVSQAGNPLSGNAYTVSLNPVSSQLEITFAVPPQSDTTCNIRVITSDEFLTCPLPPSLAKDDVVIGPGLEINELNQIIGIDAGLITP